MSTRTTNYEMHYMGCFCILILSSGALELKSLGHEGTGSCRRLKIAGSGHSLTVYIFYFSL